jgi:RHS repeat-associated protein
MTPTVSKPAELNAGGYTGDVNLFSGGYSSTIPLGKVATPGGIAFGLELNYSSSFSIGATAPISKGIPYGDGWNLNIPTISIESQIFNAFAFTDYCNENSGTGTVLNYSSVEKAINEGDLYWYSPYINIPGVASGRAIFKYVDVDDNKTVVFELNTFENHVEIRYDANKWTIITSDGTIYEFKTVIQSFNAPANKRVLYYPLNGASTPDNIANNVAGNNNYSSSNVQGIVENSITPKQRYNLWYCDAIRHKNKPFQSVVFFYKGFGKFNYFKEFQQEAFRNAAPSLLLNSTFPKEYDFSCYTDLLLTKMESYSIDGLVNRLEMKYQTNQQIINSHDELLKFNDPKNGRLDSLYTYRSVFKDDFGSSTGWKRYEHIKINHATNQYPVSSNPYLSPQGYVRSGISSNGPIPFNHSFLESPRLFEDVATAEKLIPGDIYEVKTNIIRSNASSLINGNATVDIAVVTGTLGNNVVGVNNAYNSFNDQGPTFYNEDYYKKSREINLFSTFNMALKWTLSYSEGLKQTSNFFSMPNFPTTFHGLNIQVGPGNSDINYNTQPSLAYQDINNGPFANQTYNFCTSSGVRSAADIGSNFGIGLPWAQMLPIYKRMVTYLNAFANTSDATNSIMKLWWNALVPLQGYTHDNVPTKMDESVKLSELELLRYTKNPYMLTHVEFYQVNGEVGGPVESGLHLISKKKLEYKSVSAVIPENYHYVDNDSIRYKSFMQVIVLLDKVRDIPVNGITDTTLLPTTFLSYEPFKSPFVKYNIASPLNGYTGMVLSKIVDQLGGITKIEYYPVSASDNRTRYNSNVTFKNNCSGTSVAPQYGNQSAVTVSPIVQTILKNDEDDLVKNNITITDNGHKKWTYDFDPGSKVSRRTQYFVDIPRFFETQLSSSDAGFRKVTVYGPALVEGSTNFVNKTVYEHFGNNTQLYPVAPTNQEYQDYLFHGKLKSVKEYDVTNKVHTEKLISYDYTLAYKNGYTRPNPYKEHIFWDQEYDNPGGQYEYRDYYLNLPLSITMTIPTNQTYVGPAAYPWLDIPAFNGPVETFELPKFMEFEFYPELYADSTHNPEFLFHSYFIKKTEEINRTYDDYKYKQAVIGGTTLPAVLNLDPNPFGIGFTNPIAYHGESTPRQIALIQTGDTKKIMDTLIVQSPLPDSTLYHMMKSTAIGYDEKIQLLMLQGNLSNLILKQFTTYYANAGITSLKSSPLSVINQQSYISDDVLLTLLPQLNRRSRWDFAEALLMKNTYLSDQVTQAMASSAYFNSSSFTKVLSKQPQFTETAIDKIVASRSLAHASLAVILNNQQITDANFSGIIANANVQNGTIVEIIETGGKYPSEPVFGKLINRSPAFTAQEMERIVAVADRQLETGVLNTLITKYGALNAFTNFNFTGNPLNAYCNSGVQSGWDYIETKTSYEYYEADYNGTAKGRAYKVLMGLEDIPARTVSISDHFGTGGNKTVTSLRLKHEPSWQVFSITTTSPHLPTAKDEKQYFYLFDLKNRYDRYWYNYDINDVNGVGTSFTPIVLADDLDTVMYDARWGTEFFDAYNAGAPVIPKYDGMVKSRQYGMRSTPFQQMSITKNQRDASEKRKSEYYFYDARWGTDAFSFNQTFADSSGPSCPPVGTPPADPVGCASCIRLKYGTEEQFLEQLPFNYCLWKDPVIGYFACPSSVNYALCFNGVELIDCNPAIPEDDEPGGSTNMIILTDALKRILELRSTIVQVDNVMGAVSPDFTDRRIDRSNTEIADFYITFDGTDGNGFFRRFQMVFPYDTLTTMTVLKRNQHTQPALIANSVGLKTKFYYSSTINKWTTNPNCTNPNYSFLYNYSSVVTPNIGLPVRVTVGYGRADSLGTNFEYTNDGQVKKMITPSGHTLEYTFDGLNRMTSVKENGTRLLSKNEYALWKHDFGLGFNARAEQNAVYSVLYQSMDTTMAREFQKAFVDPLGRKHGTIQAYKGGGNVQVHSGKVVYDNWGRPTNEYKPWRKDVMGTITNSNLLFDPGNPDPVTGILSNGTRYENNPKSIDILHSDFGIAIANTQNPLIRKNTCIANHIFMSCELGLSNAELKLVMNSGGTGNFRFTRVSITDQDGKESITYTNAMGQTVATLSYVIWPCLNDRVLTLFIYDSYGNLTKTINPQRQHTDYQYNMLGQLIREKNVDGGEKRYIYNRNGKIRAVQDQLDRANLNSSNDPAPRYREFLYDIYGNLVRQQLVANSIHHDPFCFITKMQGSPGSTDYFDYVFSDRMTQDWLIRYNSHDPFGSGPVLVERMPITPPYSFVVLEKQMEYGVSQASPLALGKLVKSLSYSTLGNSNGAPIQEIQYAYNTEDLLASQTIRQHPLDIAVSDQFAVRAKIEYTSYNFRGSLLEQKVDLDNNGSIEMKYFYQYDELNRLNEVLASQGDQSITDATKISAYTYDDARGTVFKKDFFVAGTGTQIQTVSNEYDHRDRLTKISSTLFTENLYYDANVLPSYNNASVAQENTFNGNIKGVQMSYNFTAAINNLTAGAIFNKPTIYGYGYDNINRLTNADAIVGYFVDAQANSTNPSMAYAIGDESWVYDKIGNIRYQYRTKPDAQPNTGTLVDDFIYTYANGTNRLTKVEDQGTAAVRNYTYDVNGNLLTDDSRNMGGTDYVRASYAQHVAIGSNDHAYYLYDGTDQRIAKKVISLAQTTQEMYIKDALGRDLAIVKFVTDNTTHNTVKSTEYFVYGTDRVARVTNELPGDYKIRPDEASFFLCDHLGNTRVAFMVNQQAVPTIINALDYYSYGKILREYDNGAGDRYLTTNHERDKETGLDYRGARYYDSDIARFLSTDPWADKYPGWSTYNYVMGNPIRLIDPTGKGVESTHIDKNGRVLHSVDDGDNGVYLHENAYTDADVKKNYKSDNTSAGGKKIGEIGGTINIDKIYPNIIETHVSTAKELYNPFEFKKLVRTGGDWDLKSNMKTIFGVANDGKTTFSFKGTLMESQDVGNHHFGIVALAFGLFPSEKFILKQAGEYQVKSGTSKPAWQKDPDKPPYGDDPRDQRFIKAGFQYYKKKWG